MNYNRLSINLYSNLSRLCRRPALAYSRINQRINGMRKVSLVYLLAIGYLPFLACDPKTNLTFPSGLGRSKVAFDSAYL